MKENDITAPFREGDIGEFVELALPPGRLPLFCGLCGHKLKGVGTDCGHCGRTWLAMMESVEREDRLREQMQEELEMTLGMAGDILRASKAHSELNIDATRGRVN